MRALTSFTDLSVILDISQIKIYANEKTNLYYGPQKFYFSFDFVIEQAIFEKN
jgi:hypothetical protein